MSRNLSPPPPGAALGEARAGGRPLRAVGERAEGSQRRHKQCSSTATRGGCRFRQAIPRVTELGS